MVSGEVDAQWYKKIWTVDIQDMSWVETTAHEVDFAVETLEMCGRERVLDLACGFGRHSLELSRRGCSLVGIDITPEYVEEACKRAREERLDAQFICADAREVSFHQEFDVVLSLADGATGYLENDEENLKVFDLIASALKAGGKHLMGICNAAYARKHFPQRHWDMGSRSLSLADFTWDEKGSRMRYQGYSFRYGETLATPQVQGSVSYIRLYTIEELKDILAPRRMVIKQTYGGYDRSIPASEDQFALVLYSQKYVE
jgi:SAM-dependent methyltransferase